MVLSGWCYQFHWSPCRSYQTSLCPRTFWCWASSASWYIFRGPAHYTVNHWPNWARYALYSLYSYLLLSFYLNLLLFVPMYVFVKAKTNVMYLLSSSRSWKLCWGTCSETWYCIQCMSPTSYLMDQIGLPYLSGRSYVLNVQLSFYVLFRRKHLRSMKLVWYIVHATAWFS